jgi:transposase
LFKGVLQQPNGGGQLNYAVDLHSNNFLIAYRDEMGRIRRKRYYFNRNGLKEFKEILMKDDVVAVESTVNAYYFYDQIHPVRFKIVCESSSKCDRKDTAAILMFLELGMLPEIKIPRQEVRVLRGLFSTYLMLNRDKTASKNRVHSILKANGVFISKTDAFSEKGREQISKIEFSDDDQLQLDILLSHVDRLENDIAQIKERILSYSFVFREELEILMTIPGISLFIGMAIMTDIADINNFKNAKKLSSYLGIVPKSRESNKKVRYGKITKKGRKTARAFMSQMVFHFINSSDFYTELYEEKKKAKGSGKAIVAMMRKLAVIIYHMLKKKQNYYHINEELHKRKLRDWLRFLEQIKSLTGEQLDKWEKEIRIKYDLAYRNRKFAELKKPA